jgi:hypothetical protein
MDSPFQTSESAARDLGATPIFHIAYTHAHFRNEELAWQFRHWLEPRDYRLHEGLPGMTASDVCYSRDAPAS